MANDANIDTNRDTNKDTSTDTKQANNGMAWNNKPCRLQGSNRIIREDLKDIKDSIFEDIYREADKTLYRIVGDKEEDNGKDDCELNVLSFLGQRGRGKTSAMLSFLGAMDDLEGECPWSECYQQGSKTIRFVTLPYIDAAMLAENEYIFDVILAEMWDEFEEYMTEKKGDWKTEDSAYQEQKIKKAFISVRRAYLGLREREQAWGGKGRYLEKDMPIPGELHELAYSLNLRDEMKKLVKGFLELLGNQRKSKNTYLVVSIDDIDMSGDKAWLILEQLRRFLRIPQVIILLTADIERLQQACESRYVGIYPDKKDRRRFVNEYLEKVLPYNMRMYMPEVSERYDGTSLDIPERREQLKLKSSTEKDMILEFIARECGIWFDGSRRSRHFLQNQSLRSMVNYFEQLSRVYKLDYYAWLKADLRERLMERIREAKQREFVDKLLSRDYEDISAVVLSFINRMLGGRGRISTAGASLGQILYGCNLLEVRDADNADFVNCIIMLYSIIISRLARHDQHLLELVLGESLFGEWEYMAVSIANLGSSDLCQGFEYKADLRIEIPSVDGRRITLSDILERNKNAIKAWAYALMFVTVISLSVEGDIVFRTREIEIEEKTNSEGAADGDSAPPSEKEEELKQNEAKSVVLLLRPVTVAARKNYFSCLFYEPEKTYDNVKRCLESACQSLVQWIAQKNGDSGSVEQMEEETAGFIDEVLQGMRLTKPVQPPVPYQNVELFYSIGQALEKIARPTGNSEQVFFAALGRKYREIQKVLLRIDQYNERFKEGEQTDFAGSFNSCFQTRLMLGEIEMADDLRKEVVKRLGGLLLETSGINIKVSDPDN